jgi:predicted GNAT family N-acyltransferase
VAFASDDYDKMVALRNAVLRVPLGRVLKPEELARDAQYTHLAAFNTAEEAIGTVLLSGESNIQARARQVAVRADMQGQGIGAKLMAYAEAEATMRGFAEMILHARNSAVHFYASIGYVAEGDFFEEAGIPHIFMRKKL